MASVRDTASFFVNGSSKQFEFVFKLYPQVLRLKAEKRPKKSEELIRLDEWYQNELPTKIKERGKDAHMNHEELVQTMKWKQQRGKFYPQLSYLIKVNTPRAVMQETKKAFRKLPNLEQALTALSNLKGVGITMASALLAAAAPENAPFMADECLKAIPEIEGIDYTTKAYLQFVSHIQITVKRLNAEKDVANEWTPHRVELALWTHYVANELQPELLEGMPEGLHPIQNGDVDTTTSNDIPIMDPSDDSDAESGPADDQVKVVYSSVINSSCIDDNSRSEDSLEISTTPIVINDETTNDSDSGSSAKRSLDGDSSEGTTAEEYHPPEIKKFRQTRESKTESNE